MADSGQLSICVVTDAYLPSIGGVENHVLHLCAELKRLGHEVVVVTHRAPSGIRLGTRDEGPGPELQPEAQPLALDPSCAASTPSPKSLTPVRGGQVESPVRVERLAGRLFVFREHDVAIDPRMVASFKRFLDRGRFDIVHGQSEGSYLVYEALAVARQRQIVTVLTRHSMIRNKPAVVRPFLISLTKLLARRADGLIAVSQACAEESAGFPGLMRVIPNGVDLGEFKPMPVERERLRAELGLAADDIVLGYVGRLHTTKGISFLLDAFEGLYCENPRLRLVLAGPGPLRASVSERAAASSGAIRLLDPMPFDKVASLLNALDVFAFPSKGEAFGIALLEAMACGLPSVAYGRWGVKELVVDGQTGLLAESFVDFARLLRRLGSNAALRRQLGRAARQSVEERFSWSHVAAETVDFYRELTAC